MRTILSVLLMALTLGACGSPRPRQPPDALEDCDINKFVVGDIYTAFMLYRERILTPQGLADAQPSFNVLALSAGGEFGAYGAAFLNGWHSVGKAALPSNRIDIQVVTGVSTGAILATHALLGEDEQAESAYRNVSGAKIYRERNILEYLYANSLLDTKGKDALIEQILKSETIDRVSRVEGRYLYIGMVDMDSGRFLRIDMVALAKQLKPTSHRDACYRAVIGASSAIPIAFPPKFVDGMMLVDGGTRRHLFLAKLPDEATKQDVTRRFFSIVHGDLDVGCTRTRNGVLQIAGRTASLTTDQGFRDSIALTHHLAIRPSKTKDNKAGPPMFETYYAAAATAAQKCAKERGACKSSGAVLKEDMFCTEFMRCLADKGKADGIDYATKGTWLTFEKLDLDSESPCMDPTTNEGFSPRSFIQ